MSPRTARPATARPAAALALSLGLVLGACGTDDSEGVTNIEEGSDSGSEESGSGSGSGSEESGSGSGSEEG